MGILYKCVARRGLCATEKLSSRRNEKIGVDCLVIVAKRRQMLPEDYDAVSNRSVLYFLNSFAGKKEIIGCFAVDCEKSGYIGINAIYIQPLFLKDGFGFALKHWRQ